MIPPFDENLLAATPDAPPELELPFVEGLTFGQEELEGVHKMFTQAKSFKAGLQARIAEWRKYMDMVPPDPPWANAPTVTVPIVRQKADGIRAHIQMSIDRQPLFTARALSSEAADISGALESVMENELTVTDSKASIDRAIGDAVVHGTGMLKIEPTGEGLLALKYVPLQNICAWPDKPDPARLFWFHAYYLPYWEMQKLADSGYLGADAVRSLKDAVAGKHDHLEEEDATHDAPFQVAGEHTWHPLVEAWGILNGNLVQIIYQVNTKTILRYEPNPHSGAFASPPFYPIYIAPSSVSVWGQGIAEILTPNQITADTAINNELWHSQYKMKPPIFVRAGSRLHRTLQQAGGVFPGQVIPFDGVDLDEMYKVPEYSINPFNLQILSLMNQLTEDATVSDFMVPGSPMGGRKTATEVNITASIGQLKLANFLRNVGRSLEALSSAYWKVIVRSRIRNAAENGLPRGVFSVYSHNGSGRVYLAAQKVDFVYESPQGLYQVYIPSAQRDDFQWKLTGSVTIPEKELRLSRLMMFINPVMIQIIQIARQDPGIHILLRRILSEMNLGQDVDAIIGPPPQMATPGEAAIMGLLQGMTGQTPMEEE